MTQQIHTTLTDEMHEQLSRLAQDRGVPVSWLVREAIASYMLRSARIKIEEIHPVWGGWRGEGDDDENGEQ